MKKIHDESMLKNLENFLNELLINFSFANLFIFVVFTMNKGLLHDIHTGMLEQQ